jgi:hypothetical protein
MTRTARRRWTRELESEVDGVLFGARGPVVLHGYDPPAGGKWVEDVIPGKLGAFDRQTGERLWLSPCEVGYGRGFGAGFGSADDVLVLGPGQGGHRIARIALETGELLGIEPLPEFDTAMVGSDVSVVVGPTQLVGVMSPTLQTIWTYRASGMRFHRAARDGERVYTAFSKKGSRNQGLLAVGVEGGEKLGEVMPPNQPAIDGLEASEGVLVMLLGDLLASLPEEEQRDFQLKKLLAEDPEDFGGSSSGAAPGLLAMNLTRSKDPRVTWYRELVGAEPGEATIAMDSGKVYEARGTQLAVLDALSGRELGQAMVPGLDEHVAWSVRDGAFLLAEENRVSVYEIPD